MLHKASGKVAGQARQASFAGEDLHKTMCHRQTKWRSRTLRRRLSSWHCSSNFKPDQRGTCSIQLIPLAALIWQACYRSQACQANTHLDLGCMGEEPFRPGAAKALRGHLASRRDKILLGHCVCRSFNNLHRQNWLGTDRKFCVAWARKACYDAVYSHPKKGDISILAKN